MMTDRSCTPAKVKTSSFKTLGKVRVLERFSLKICQVTYHVTARPNFKYIP